MCKIQSRRKLVLKFLEHFMQNYLIYGHQPRCGQLLVTPPVPSKSLWSMYGLSWLLWWRFEFSGRDWSQGVSINVVVFISLLVSFELHWDLNIEMGFSPLYRRKATQNFKPKKATVLKFTLWRPLSKVLFFPFPGDWSLEALLLVRNAWKLVFHVEKWIWGKKEKSNKMKQYK